MRDPIFVIRINRRNSVFPLPINRGRGFGQQRVSGDATLDSDRLLTSDLIVEVEERPTSRLLSAIRRDEENGTAFSGANLPIRLVQQEENKSDHEDKTLQPNDISWGIQAVKADQSPYIGSGVTVAILDTGIDRHHIAFKALHQKGIVECDFTNSIIGDEHGHGTHCAGTICGGIVNGKRIGVAPGIGKLVTGKILRNSSAHTDCATFVDALIWAILKQNANIVSMSCEIDFGEYIRQFEEEGFPRQQAISHGLNRYYKTRSVFEDLHKILENNARDSFLMVSAVGNGSGRDKNPPFVVDASIPAVSKGIISVGALEKGENGLKVAPFSNGSPLFVAPGVKILSARLGGGLSCMNGTSFAVPHVAGIAALWLEKLSSQGIVSGDRFRSCLIRCASDKEMEPGLGYDSIGVGIVIAPVE
jgi:hypothetical protein